RAIVGVQRGEPAEVERLLHTLAGEGSPLLVEMGAAPCRIGRRRDDPELIGAAAHAHPCTLRRPVPPPLWAAREEKSRGRNEALAPFFRSGEGRNAAAAGRGAGFRRG